FRRGRQFTAHQPAKEEDDHDRAVRQRVHQADLLGARAAGDLQPIQQADRRRDQAADQTRADQVERQVSPWPLTVENVQDVEDDGRTEQAQREDDQHRVKWVAEDADATVHDDLFLNLISFNTHSSLAIKTVVSIGGSALYVLPSWAIKIGHLT